MSVGEVWCDEDGHTWRIVAVKKKWIFVRRHGYPKSALIQTNPAWFDVWTRV